MTKNEIIRELERIKEIIVDSEDLTDSTREHAYYDIEDAIEQICENEE